MPCSVAGKAGHQGLRRPLQSLPGPQDCKPGLGSCPGAASPRAQRGKKTLSGLSEEPGAASCLKLSVKSEICNRRNISLYLSKPSLCVFPPGYWGAIALRPSPKTLGWCVGSREVEASFQRVATASTLSKNPSNTALSWRCKGPREAQRLPHWHPAGQQESLFSS